MDGSNPCPTLQHPPYMRKIVTNQLPPPNFDNAGDSSANPIPLVDAPGYSYIQRLRA